MGRCGFLEARWLGGDATLSRQQGQRVKIESVHLPEFGLDVNWAMCRNPMCKNFGVRFEGEIPKGRTQVTDDRYVVRESTAALRVKTADIECRYCGQTAHLASNRAIRPIARYFLSLSMPFADCPNVECTNHGINMFENWADRSHDSQRYYRREREHLARCRACGKSFPVGEPFGVRTKLSKEERAQKEDELKRKQKDLKRKQKELEREQDKHVSMESLWLLEDKRKRRKVRASWDSIIEGVRTRRSITNTIEVLDIGVGNYYRSLDQIGARLRDFHAYQNARLLRSDIPHRKQPVRVYTDVLKVSLRAHRRDNRHAYLNFIVSAIPIDGTIFVLAAHPYFLPKSLCPSIDACDADSGPDCNSEWGCLFHSPPDSPDLPTSQRQKAMPILGRGGFFIRSPYAELAHFLVVQKMLARFDTIYAYTDGAKEMYTAALVAFRDRILAGCPDAAETRDKRRRVRRAEIIVFQHDTRSNQSAVPLPKQTVSPKEAPKLLASAWKTAEARYYKQETPKKLRGGTADKDDPRVRAQLFRSAYKGAYSDGGSWAWLSFPPPSIAYRKPRTLWLTRMPGKTFETHGRPALLEATLQPVDSMFNSVRARTAAASRPVLRAKGRGYRNAYFLPSVVLNELSVYLIGRNYMLRRKTAQKKIPAVAMGLAPSSADPPADNPAAGPRAAGRHKTRPDLAKAAADTPAARPQAADRHETRLNLAKVACDFRLGISHARRISGWRRR